MSVQLHIIQEEEELLLGWGRVECKSLRHTLISVILLLLKLASGSEVSLYMATQTAGEAHYSLC